MLIHTAYFWCSKLINLYFSFALLIHIFTLLIHEFILLDHKFTLLINFAFRIRKFAFQITQIYTSNSQISVSDYQIHYFDSQVTQWIRRFNFFIHNSFFWLQICSSDSWSRSFYSNFWYTNLHIWFFKLGQIYTFDSLS